MGLHLQPSGWRRLVLRPPLPLLPGRLNSLVESIAPMRLPQSSEDSGCTSLSGLARRARMAVARCRSATALFVVTAFVLARVDTAIRLIPHRPRACSLEQVRYRTRRTGSSPRSAPTGRNVGWKMQGLLLLERCFARSIHSHVPGPALSYGVAVGWASASFPAAAASRSECPLVDS